MLCYWLSFVGGGSVLTEFVRKHHGIFKRVSSRAMLIWPWAIYLDLGLDLFGLGSSY
jgi:hypothetical protein